MKLKNQNSTEREAWRVAVTLSTVGTGSSRDGAALGAVASAELTHSTHVASWLSAVATGYRSGVSECRWKWLTSAELMRTSNSAHAADRKRWRAELRSPGFMGMGQSWPVIPIIGNARPDRQKLRNPFTTNRF